MNTQVVDKAIDYYLNVCDVFTGAERDKREYLGLFGNGLSCAIYDVNYV